MLAPLTRVTKLLSVISAVESAVFVQQLSCVPLTVRLSVASHRLVFISNLFREFVASLS